MSIYLPTAAVAYYEGRPERTIRDWMSKGKYEVKTEIEGGVTRHLILLDSLSERARREYLRDQEAQRKPKPKQQPPQQEKPDVLGKLKRKYGKRGEELIEEVVQREQIAKLVLSIRASKEKNKTERINALALSVGQSPATIRRWADKYLELGQDGLIHNKVLDSLFAPKTYKSFHPLAQDYLRVLYLDDRQRSVEMCYEMTLDMAKQKGWKVGSYATAWRIIQDIPEEDIIYFREGLEAWKAKCMPRALREDPELINEVFESDHTRMNFFINYGGKPIRPWLTKFIEVKSRVVVGWCVSLQANAETIGLALRHAILPKPNSPVQGLPKYVLIDNGKDYRSKRISGEQNPDFAKELTAPHLQGLFGRLGIMARNCQVRNGAGKGRVERKFRVATERFYREYIGWCGANPKERPENFNEHKLCAEGKLVEWDQMIEDFKAFIDELNNTPLDVLDGKTPLEVYTANKRWKEEIPSARVLDLWLLPGEARKVHNIGVKFQNRVYENTKELSGHVREEISILYDPNDLSQIYAYTLDGDFIGELPLKQRRAYITEDEDTFKHVAKQKARRTDVKGRKEEMLERLKEEGVDKPRKMQRIASTGDNEGAPKVVQMHRDEQVAKKVEASRNKAKEPKPASLHDEYVKRRSDEVLKQMKLS